MERVLSISVAFLCLAAGAIFFALTGEASPPKKPEKEFTARVFTSKPAEPRRAESRYQEETPSSAPQKPKKAKKAAKRTLRKAKRPRLRSRSPGQEEWQPVEIAGFNDSSAASEGSLVGPEWESSVQYYSGSSYGVAHINKHAKKAGNGGYPNDRAIVRSAAAKYGIPFALLWGTYGAESSWGKNTGGGELPPYFGLTAAYPGGGQTRYRGTSGNFVADAEKSARSWLKIYRLKNDGRNPA